MCSINGFTFRDEELIQKMNAVTAHRGPDGGGVFSEEGISLGHRRLSIIDLSDDAAQPMKSHDGRFIITYNGELYNYLDLKSELSSYQYRTQSDTEVILAAYERWGVDCVKRFNGIFAIAIWDRKKGELFLARDPMGIKPLYYYKKDGKFIFASEIKAILEHNIPRIIDREALNLYFSVHYVPAPLTMIKGIKKFPSANVAVVRGGKIELKQYWKDESSEMLTGDKRDLVDKVRNGFVQAVERQLVSDRPLGVYLSGGIDSSSIVAAMKMVRSDVDTFSVGYDLRDNEERAKFNVDFEAARRTAEYFGTTHHEIMISSDDVVDSFEDVIRHSDEPIANPTSFAMFKLSGFAKNFVSVALAGDGGDELFGGYPRYRRSQLIDLYQRFVPSFLRRIVAIRGGRFAKVNIPAGVDRYAQFFFQDEAVLRRIIRNEIIDTDPLWALFQDRFSESDYPSFVERFMDVDRRTWLMDQMFMLTDKMSMAHGLEVRVPFLDLDFFKLATSIPVRHKVSAFDTKIILKEAFKKDLPSFLFDLPKRGWISPGAKWLRHDRMRNFTNEVLSESYYEETSDLFQWENIREMVKFHRDGSVYNLIPIWDLLTFQVWARSFNAHF